MGSEADFLLDSTVAPVYNSWYNVNRLPTDEERLNPSGGYFRVDMLDEPPSSEWGPIAETIHRTCHEVGLECLTREERLEKVPFVLEAVFDENDDEDDWDEYAPETLEECTVWQWKSSYVSMGTYLPSWLAFVLRPVS